MSEEREHDEIDALIDSLDELPDPLRPDEHSEDESIAAFTSGPDEMEALSEERGMLEEGLWDDWDEPPNEGFADESWTHVRIFSRGGPIAHGWPFTGYSFENAARTEWATNDDNDDGVDDGEVVRANYDFKTVWEALEFHGGGSRQGVLSEVTVWLDGCVILSEHDFEHGPDEPEHRPYCKWPGKGEE